MSTLIDGTIIQWGEAPSRQFDLSCTSGDWQSMDILFPQPFPPQAHISVIATASDFGVGDLLHNEPVVGVVEDLTLQGFRLWARNPHECARSSAGFNWLAVAEDEYHGRWMSSIRLGVVRPQFFAGRCQGPPASWDVRFGSRRWIGTPAEPPVVLATATNLNVWATTTEWQSLSGGPWYAHTLGVSYNAAVVAAVQGASQNGFRLKGSNLDGLQGNCAFFYAAFADWPPRTLPGQHPYVPGSPDVFVETGRVGAQEFQPADNLGDWRLWDIEFEDPFMTPPTVLVTANDLMEDDTPVPDHGAGGVFGKAVAAVGVAQNVTTHGFTLKARNSDCTGGFAGFFWVAFGCERFCA